MNRRQARERKRCAWFLTLFGIFVALAVAGCGPSQPNNRAIFSGTRVLASGDTLIYLTWTDYALAGNPLRSYGVYCRRKDVEITPSITIGDQVRYYLSRCSSSIAKFDTQPDGTTVKR